MTGNEGPGYNHDESFAFLEVLRILSKTSDLKNWLKQYHNLQNMDDVLEGYKYIITTALKCFMQSIMMHDPFKLKDDRFLLRVDFRVGLSLDDAPNRCEKTIFLKNIWNLGKDIRKARNWDELNVSKSLSILLNLYEKLLHDNVKSNYDVPKEDALNCVTQFWAYLYLIDCSFGMPKGSRGSLFDIENSKKYLDRVFTGYRYSLQFLWFKLLGKEKFENSVLKDLHRSIEIKFERPDKSIKISFKDLGMKMVGSPPESEEEKQRRLEHEKFFAKWMSIDQFFNEIRGGIIRPMEKLLDGRLGGMGKGLLKIENFEKKMLNGLLKEVQVQEPEYFLKKDKKSLKKQIDCEFLWYDLGVLNAGLSLDFSGAFAFIPMLTGYVKVLQKKDIDGKVSVMILKHPSSDNEGNDYSFGVLVSIGGFFSDASGWLIFFDSTTDYSGGGSELHKQCIDTIKKFQSENKIEVKELTIEKNIFQEFLGEKNLPIDNTSIKRIYEDVKGKVSKLKGKFFEYIVYKWLNEKNHYDEVKCDVPLHNGQIDCYGKNEKSIDIFECKLQMHGDEKKIIKQLISQTNALKQKDSSLKIVPHLVVYQSILAETKSKLEEQGITVYANFRKFIQDDEIFDGSRREIQSIFESTMRQRYEYY